MNKMYNTFLSRLVSICKIQKKKKMKQTTSKNMIRKTIHRFENNHCFSFCLFFLKLGHNKKPTSTFTKTKKKQEQTNKQIKTGILKE